MSKINVKRCDWAESDPLMSQYHDKEWGRPVHQDIKLFEFLLLESFQAGLNWIMILKKRDNFRKAFANFDPKKIVQFTTRDVKRLLLNAGIIRNRLKIASAITNADAFLRIQKEFGSFDSYIWAYVKKKPIKNSLRSTADMPSSTPLSDAISKDLKNRGFKFVGTTIIYAFMQAIGMTNDHTKNCFRYGKK